MNDADAARLRGEKKRTRRMKRWALLWCGIAVVEWLLLITGCSP